MTRSAEARCSSKPTKPATSSNPETMLGPERGEPSGEPAGGTGSWQCSDVHAEIGPVPVRETLEPSGQRLDLFGRGALLRGKDPCCVQEPGRHVAGGDELDAL